MPLDVVVVMDPIGSIKIAKDSTFAMLLEAQRRGHRLHYVLPGGLSVELLLAGWLRTERDVRFRPRLVVKALLCRRRGKHSRGSG